MGRGAVFIQTLGTLVKRRSQILNGEKTDHDPGPGTDLPTQTRIDFPLEFGSVGRSCLARARFFLASIGTLSSSDRGSDNVSLRGNVPSGARVCLIRNLVFCLLSPSIGLHILRNLKPMEREEKTRLIT